VRTVGARITHLTPMQGFCAEAGVPVSTTHTITGAVVGVGSARRVSASAGAWHAPLSLQGLTVSILENMPEGSLGPPAVFSVFVIVIVLAVTRLPDMVLQLIGVVVFAQPDGPRGVR
jgi:phosphate/sulfate permease